jgi:hypothetical protein
METRVLKNGWLEPVVQKLLLHLSYEEIEKGLTGTLAKRSQFAKEIREEIQSIKCNYSPPNLFCQPKPSEWQSKG